MLRTFVWYPDELQRGDGGAVKQLPQDTMLMQRSWVAQDWQMRGVPAPELGPILQAKRPRVVEGDGEGEYFLHNQVAQLHGGDVEGAVLIAWWWRRERRGSWCGVDRYDDSVLFQPSEVNLWAMGMLASGATDSEEGRSGTSAAAYRYPTLERVAAWGSWINALKPTSDVVAELVSVGPFTRLAIRVGTRCCRKRICWVQNWQNWQWDETYVPAYHNAEHGDASFIENVRKQKAIAAVLADACLKNLKGAREGLPPVEYAILRTKLMTNKVQLAIRTPMVMAALEWRAAQNTQDEAEKQARLAQMKEDADAVRTVVTPPVQSGRTWWRPILAGNGWWACRRGWTGMRSCTGRGKRSDWRRGSGIRAGGMGCGRGATLYIKKVLWPLTGEMLTGVTAVSSSGSLIEAVRVQLFEAAGAVALVGGNHLLRAEDGVDVVGDFVVFFEHGVQVELGKLLEALAVAFRDE